MKCLIVDDSESARELLRLILEQPGLDILEAEDGEAAMREALRHVPDLIILDIGLPKMDGFAVLAALRQHPVFVLTRVIGLSAAAGDTQPEVLAAAGFTHFLTKPVRPAVLRAMVADMQASVLA